MRHEKKKKKKEQEGDQKSVDEDMVDVKNMEYVKPKHKSAKKLKKHKVQVSETDTEEDINCDSSSSSEEVVVVKKKKLKKKIKKRKKKISSEELDSDSDTSY